MVDAQAYVLDRRPTVRVLQKDGKDHIIGERLETDIDGCYLWGELGRGRSLSAAWVSAYNSVRYTEKRMGREL